jgi:hypothetical protein
MNTREGSGAERLTVALGAMARHCVTALNPRAAGAEGLRMLGCRSEA